MNFSGCPGIFQSFFSLPESHPTKASIWEQLGAIRGQIQSLKKDIKMKKEAKTKQKLVKKNKKNSVPLNILIFPNSTEKFDFFFPFFFGYLSVEIKGRLKIFGSEGHISTFLGFLGCQLALGVNWGIRIRFDSWQRIQWRLIFSFWGYFRGLFSFNLFF